MLHLHCFKGEQALPPGNLFSLRNVDRCHFSRHRCLNFAVVGSVRGARATASEAELKRLTFVEHDNPLVVAES